MSEEFFEIVEDHLDELIESLKESVNEALRESTEEIVEAIKATAIELCPVSPEGEGGKHPHKPGNLKASIFGQVSSGGHYGKVGIDVKKAPYGPWVHFGTRFHAGRPFVYQAKERHVEGYAETIENKISEKLEENE